MLGDYYCKHHGYYHASRPGCPICIDMAKQNAMANTQVYNEPTNLSRIATALERIADAIETIKKGA